MTRKHYVALAADWRKLADETPDPSGIAVKLYEAMIIAFIVQAKRADPAFSADKFKTACGL